MNDLKRRIRKREGHYRKWTDNMMYTGYRVSYRFRKMVLPQQIGQQ